MKKVILILSLFIIAILLNIALSKNINAKRKKRKYKTVSAILLRVSDGDTITVRIAEKKERIRFAGIDAPEKKQSFGKESTEYLKSLLSKNLKIKYKKRDRYRRIIAYVFSKSKNTNEEMIKAGYAWHYRRYSKKKKLAKLETRARKNKLGLWKKLNPAPPWFYRKYKRPKFNLPNSFTARVAYIPLLRTIAVIYKNRGFYLKLNNIKCTQTLNSSLQRQLYEKIVFKKIKIKLTKKHKNLSNQIFGTATIKKFNLEEFYKNANCIVK